VTKDNGYVQQVGVRITAEGVRMPGDQHKLPRKLDNPGWKHPVFGHRDRWATTKSPNPGWFINTAARNAEMATRRVERVLDKYAAALASRLRRAA
jgi:hypothetical protein